MKRFLFSPASGLLLALLLATGFVGCDSASPETTSADGALAQQDPASTELGPNGHAPPGRVLAAIRRATARYHRVQVALDDEYAQASPCVESPLGGMGYHYANFGLVDGVVDPSAPELLLYEPQRNGRLKLVGVEFMVHADAWDPFNDGPPTLAGQPFDDHRAEGPIRHGIDFPHYDLHVWVWQHNPSGMFFPFNPTVSCEHAGDGGGEH